MVDSIDQSKNGQYTILDVLVAVSNNLRIFTITTLIFFALGVLMAIRSDTQFRATARVLREATQESASASSLGGLRALEGFGINLGGGTAGMTVEAYPDILRSRQLAVAVVNTPIEFLSSDSKLTLVQYLKENQGIVSKLRDTIEDLFKRDNRAEILTALAGAEGDVNQSTVPEKWEERALETLAEFINVGIDKISGIMTITVTTTSPALSYQICRNLLTELNARVREIHKLNTSEEILFLRNRYDEALIELEQSEKNLADFLDSNSNPTTAALQTEIERLRRKMTFSTQVALSFQSQLTQAQVEIQKTSPILTVIDAPNIPLEPSGPKRLLMVLGMLFVGALFGFMMSVITSYINNIGDDPIEATKLNIIKGIFRPGTKN